MVETQHATLAQLEACLEGITPQVFMLDTSECTLGRLAECNVVIPIQYVSRLHARVLFNQATFRYILIDNQSENGTFLNGQRIPQQPVVLKNGDEIGLGGRHPCLRFIDLYPTERGSHTGRYNLSYKETTGDFQIQGQILNLTHLEQRFLVYLYLHHGRLCSFDELIAALWEPNNLHKQTKPRRLNELRISIHHKIHRMTGIRLIEYIQHRRQRGFILHLQPQPFEHDDD